MDCLFHVKQLYQKKNNWRLSSSKTTKQIQGKFALDIVGFRNKAWSNFWDVWIHTCHMMTACRNLPCVSSWTCTCNCQEKDKITESQKDYNIIFITNSCCPLRKSHCWVSLGAKWTKQLLQWTPDHLQILCITWLPESSLTELNLTFGWHTCSKDPDKF